MEWASDSHAGSAELVQKVPQVCQGRWNHGVNALVLLGLSLWRRRDQSAYGLWALVAKLAKLPSCLSNKGSPPLGHNALQQVRRPFQVENVNRIAVDT